MRNNVRGISYHYPGQLLGDYDKGKTEEEIKNIIINGFVERETKK
jgi:hypothetical protein